MTGAVVFLGVAGLSSSVDAGVNRGGHEMNGNECDFDAATCQDDNVLYDNGDGNGGEDVNGYTEPDEEGDVDPMEPDDDEDAAKDAAEAEAEALEDAADVSD